MRRCRELGIEEGGGLGIRVGLTGQASRNGTRTRPSGSGKAAAGAPGCSV